jgi:hypothetical protein
MSKNCPAIKNRLQYNLVAVPPGGPAPTKSTRLDLESPNLGATPQIAVGKMEDEAVELSDPAAATPTNNSRPNGADVDARMAKIEEILDHAATHVLEKCALVAEWVRHAEAKASVYGQVVSKPQGGRPEGGVSRAARELPVPGKTFGARRKYIVRAVDIDAISDDAKAAARTARLDDKKTALMAIASERAPEAQLAKVRELATRKAIRRRKSSARDERAATSKAQSSTTGVTNPDTSDKQSELPGKHEIDAATLASKPDQSKPASVAVLVEFSKFMLAHITQGDQIALTLTANADVREFNRLANRVRLVLGKGTEDLSIGAFLFYAHRVGALEKGISKKC